MMTQLEYAIWNLEQTAKRMEEALPKAQAAVAASKNSRWAIVDDLANAYAQEGVAHSLNQLLGLLREGPENFGELIDRLQAQMVDELIRTQVSSQSTSIGSNAIASMTGKALATAIEALKYLPRSNG